MCNKLLQIYACNHSKVICTTPCPHALDTGIRVPTNSAADTPRSSSVSSIVRSERESVIDNTSTPRQSRSPMPSPLRHSTPARRSPPPASRFVAPSPGPSSPPPGYPGHSPTSPVSPISQRSTWSGTSQLSVSPTSPDLAVSPTPATLPDEEFDTEPNFCDYYFPRYLAQSSQPCLECYMSPEWESLAREWVKKYRLEHFVSEKEDAEKLTGIEELKRRYEERTREGI